MWGNHEFTEVPPQHPKTRYTLRDIIALAVHGAINRREKMTSAQLVAEAYRRAGIDLPTEQRR
jgi:hypothetical protein